MPRRFAELSVFQIALKDPVVAEAMAGLLVALLENGRLDPRLRELAIMRIGWTTNSVYEWTQHWRIANETPARTGSCATAYCSGRPKGACRRGSASSRQSGRI